MSVSEQIMTHEHVYSCIRLAVSDRVYAYNSMYTGDLLVDVDTKDDGTFRFVYYCDPNMEDKPWLDHYLFQIQNLIKLANIMIGGTSCV